MKTIKITISSYIWVVKFLDSNQMRKNDYGTCWTLQRTIEIDNQLGYEETKIILGHELVHAYLAVYGRNNTDVMDTEDVCDFIAWNMDELIRKRNEILGKRFYK